MHKKIIIGAGLAGCSCARILAEKGFEVEIYEIKDHIGGNIFDYVDRNNILVHKYGPHIFHTSYEEVWEFVNRFSKFDNYVNRVLVYVGDKLVKMPINLDSIEALFPNKAKVLIEEFEQLSLINRSVSISELLKRVKQPDSKEIINYIWNNVYATYTSKMWEIEIQDVDSKILERVKLNLNREWNYFLNDKYQGLPIGGYTNMLSKMLDHSKIKLHLNTNALDFMHFNNSKLFFKNEEQDIIFTGPIDALFNFQFGELEYRSLDIKFEEFNYDSFQEAAIINYPSHPTMTRICEYKKMTSSKSSSTVISKEFPGQYNKESKRFNIPYYPINSERNTNLLNQYQELSKKYKNLMLIGRLSEYKYYDMDDIIYSCMQKLKNN